MFHRPCNVQGLYFDRGCCGDIFGLVLFMMLVMFLLLEEIWGYAYLQRYHSFVTIVYLNYVQVCTYR
jgi:hypothetical protein